MYVSWQLPQVSVSWHLKCGTCCLGYRNLWQLNLDVCFMAARTRCLLPKDLGTWRPEDLEI
eukprot:5355830-Alexandrium_andersonii.AAC.1